MSLSASGTSIFALCHLVSTLVIKQTVPRGNTATKVVTFYEIEKKKSKKVTLGFKICRFQRQNGDIYNNIIDFALPKNKET